MFKKYPNYIGTLAGQLTIRNLNSLQQNWVLFVFSMTVGRYDFCVEGNAKFFSTTVPLLSQNFQLMF